MLEMRRTGFLPEPTPKPKPKAQDQAGQAELGVAEACSQNKTLSRRALVALVLAITTPANLLILAVNVLAVLMCLRVFQRDSIYVLYFRVFWSLKPARRAFQVAVERAAPPGGAGRLRRAALVLLRADLPRLAAAAAVHAGEVAEDRWRSPVSVNVAVLRRNRMFALGEFHPSRSELQKAPRVVESVTRDGSQGGYSARPRG